MALELLQDNDTGLTSKPKINALISELNSIKRYHAAITQIDSPSAPSVDFILKNDFNGVNFEWEYVSAGIYDLVADQPIFTEGKTVSLNSNNFFNAARFSDTKGRLTCFFPANGQLDKASFILNVYQS